MIGVLTHHWSKEDKVAEARKLLDRNGLAQSKAPGFVSRQTLWSLTDSTKITTLWESNDIYDAWRASPERAAAMAGAWESNDIYDAWRASPERAAPRIGGLRGGRKSSLEGYGAAMNVCPCGMQLKGQSR